VARRSPVEQTGPVRSTLTFDCGGTGIKAAVVDESGAMLSPPVRVPTPYPLPPTRLIETLRKVAADLPAADRVTAGLPGMIRHGVVIATPHYVTREGPFSAVDPALAEAWSRFDARAALADAFGVPALVLNDAEVHGAWLVTGLGLELVLTLGTGLGCAVFDHGVVAPHLELSHARVRPWATYDTYLGDRVRRRLGTALWARRVRAAVADLRPVFRWDRLYLGGGNARLLRPADVAALGDDVEIVGNIAGVQGGSRAWTMARG
jgi:polyphosphate glucokinase